LWILSKNRPREPGGGGDEVWGGGAGGDAGGKRGGFGGEDGPTNKARRKKEPGVTLFYGGTPTPPPPRALGKKPGGLPAPALGGGGTPGLRPFFGLFRRPGARKVPLPWGGRGGLFGAGVPCGKENFFFFGRRGRAGGSGPPPPPGPGGAWGGRFFFFRGLNPGGGDFAEARGGRGSQPVLFPRGQTKGSGTGGGRAGAARGGFPFSAAGPEGGPTPRLQKALTDPGRGPLFPFSGPRKIPLPWGACRLGAAGQPGFWPRAGAFCKRLFCVCNGPFCLRDRRGGPSGRSQGLILFRKVTWGGGPHPPGPATWGGGQKQKPKKKKCFLGGEQNPRAAPVKKGGARNPRKIFKGPGPGRFRGGFFFCFSGVLWEKTGGAPELWGAHPKRGKGFSPARGLGRGPPVPRSGGKGEGLGGPRGRCRHSGGGTFFYSNGQAWFERAWGPLGWGTRRFRGGRFGGPQLGKGRMGGTFRGGGDPGGGGPYGAARFGLAFLLNQPGRFCVF